MNRGMSSARGLARGGRVRGCELRISLRPNASNAATGTDEKGGLCKANERQQQRVLNQILTVFISNKPVH